MFVVMFGDWSESGRAGTDLRDWLQEYLETPIPPALCQKEEIVSLTKNTSVDFINRKLFLNFKIFFEKVRGR